MNTGLLRHAVATVLTVYGIETFQASMDFPCNGWGCNSAYRLRYWNASYTLILSGFISVATVLTVYGIETFTSNFRRRTLRWLQQCLPFTVLKLFLNERYIRFFSLQQCLPFTVLKPTIWRWTLSIIFTVATVLTVYGIETEFLDI